MAKKVSIVFCGTLLFALSSFQQVAGQNHVSGEPRTVGQPLVVRADLADGQTFHAMIDCRTDEDRLWLRWSYGTISFLRPIRWEQVVRAKLCGTTLAGEQLLEAVQIAVKDRPSRQDDAKSIVMIGTDRAEAPCEYALPVAEPETKALHISARTANWDSDVEVDGLLVDVCPMNADGDVLAVNGTLDVDLVGWKGRHRSSIQLGHWSRRVDRDAFEFGRIRFRLPFEAIHPEFTPEVSAYGAVHARLAVAGSGTFEATDSDVRIRPISSTRDRLERTTGRRFFSFENTSR